MKTDFLKWSIACVDGRQDATLILTIGENSKTFIKTTFEENYVKVGEPDS